MITIAQTPPALLAHSLLALSSTSWAAAEGCMLQLLTCADVAVVVLDFPIQRHTWAFPAAAKAQADYELGERIGHEYVPLIFAISGGETSPRWVEVMDTAMLDLAITEMCHKPLTVTRP